MQVAISPKRWVDIVKMPILPSRVLAAVGKVSPPNCRVIIEKGLPPLMMDSVIVHPGRDRGRSSGTIGAADILEMARIPTNGIFSRNRAPQSI